MMRMDLDIETLACEASAEDVLDDLLAHPGVRSAEVDLVGERIQVAVEGDGATREEIVHALSFFGLSVRRSS